MHSDTLVLKIKKRTMLTEMRLKSFATFEKRAPDQLFIVVTLFTRIDGVRILH